MASLLLLLSPLRSSDVALLTTLLPHFALRRRRCLALVWIRCSFDAAERRLAGARDRAVEAAALRPAAVPLRYRPAAWGPPPASTLRDDDDDAAADADADAAGLYAEQLSGTAFTAPRTRNLRTWLYRIRPSVTHEPFQPTFTPTSILGDFRCVRACVHACCCWSLWRACGCAQTTRVAHPPPVLERDAGFLICMLKSCACQPLLSSVAEQRGDVLTTPNQLRWGALPLPPALDEQHGTGNGSGGGIEGGAPADFVHGMHTFCGAGSAATKSGYAVHMYTANQCMLDSCLVRGPRENARAPFALLTEPAAVSPGQHGRRHAHCSSAWGIAHYVRDGQDACGGGRDSGDAARHSVLGRSAGPRCSRVRAGDFQGPLCATGQRSHRSERCAWHAVIHVEHDKDPGFDVDARSLCAFQG
eukprot:scaffold3281_cov286-Prasinococcus_capsulatus_cf.AAC.5